MDCPWKRENKQEPRCLEEYVIFQPEETWRHCLQKRTCVTTRKTPKENRPEKKQNTTLFLSRHWTSQTLGAYELLLFHSPRVTAQLLQPRVTKGFLTTIPSASWVPHPHQCPSAATNQKPRPRPDLSDTPPPPCRQWSGWPQPSAPLQSCTLPAPSPGPPCPGPCFCYIATNSVCFSISPVSSPQCHLNELNY